MSKRRKRKKPNHDLLVRLRGIVDPVGGLAAMVIERQQKEINRFKREIEQLRAAGV